ncbi:peptidylprolyl isomerase [Pseudidiomarina aestuarii]|uniref:Periplasmic chaperone PpiD n=1 Tax=Pseudidiomarina aestuarii TaxID=624146 RepID=A0A2T4D3V9_9GAMM|nr:peptidylprolyl isomerase [Pseudidiomarina aestuarii]PTB88489.1 peptidylprolyl isomerase [Pseudidiomarina aestuarii]PTB89405.1 peptidylprolyl isomerase [Pseudidiomarina aestuarii]
MLDSIRERSQSFIVKAILVFLALTFALFGIGSYVTNQPDPAVAIVNGEEIAQAQFDREVENERNRQQQQLGDFYATLSADPAFNQRLRQQVLDRLIDQKLVEQYAQDRGLRVSNEQVKTAIREFPAFQVAGQFDNQTYRMVLAQNGFSVDGFAELMRGDMARTQLLESILETDFVLADEVQQVQALVNQSRSGGYREIALADYLETVEITDEDIETWYQQNRDRFAVPEQVRVEFVALEAGAIAEAIEIDENLVREWYESNRSQYETASRARFSHILIEAEDGNADARAEAEALLAEINSGADFAEVAKANSDDVFSGEQGGDLDFIEAGTMDPDFEAAAFALENVGDVSDVVETSFGFHIIKLTDREEGSVTPFEEVRDEIVNDLREERVKQRYYELQQGVAEASFEMPDTLQPAVEGTQLTVRTSDWFNRDTAPSALNHPAVLQQVFNNEFIAEGLNSDLIETSDTESVVVRVLEHRPASTRALDEVRDTVTTQLRRERAQAAATEQAEAIAEQLRAGEASVELTVLDAVDRRTDEHPRAIVQALFNMAAPAEGTTAVTTATLNNGNVAVVQLSQVMAGEPDAELATSLQEQLETSNSQQLYMAFIEGLRAEAEIEMVRSN